MIPRNALLYLVHLRSLPEHTDMTIAIDDIIALCGRHLIITPLMLQHCRGC
jgi:hypothetical protein